MICQKIDSCQERRTQQKDTFDERGACKSIYQVRNPLGVAYHKIDFENCVYDNRQNDTKCDFGLLTDETIIYIELKGSQVKKGLKQLIATMEETGNCFGTRQKKARLVVSKSPANRSLKKMPEYVRLSKMVKATDNNKNLKVEGRVFTETI